MARGKREVGTSGEENISNKKQAEKEQRRQPLPVGCGAEGDLDTATHEALLRAQPHPINHFSNAAFEPPRAGQEPWGSSSSLHSPGI